jgi:hypothetical protein
VNLRQKGLAQDVAEATMQAWNLKNRTANGDPNPLDAVEVSETRPRAYENGYDFGCHDPVLDAYCHETCFIYPPEDEGERDPTNVLENGHPDRSARPGPKYLAYTKERDLAKVSWGIPGSTA